PCGSSHPEASNGKPCGRRRKAPPSRGLWRGRDKAAALAAVTPRKGAVRHQRFVHAFVAVVAGTQQCKQQEAGIPARQKYPDQPPHGNHHRNSPLLIILPRSRELVPTPGPPRG